MSRLYALIALLVAIGAPARAQVVMETGVDRLELRGAGNIMAALEELAETFMTEHPKETIILGKASAERGLKALISGVTEMAMAVDEMPDDMTRLAVTHNVKLIKTCIFVDGVVPVVAESNPVTNLTLKQLRDIFRGEIKNWKEVGGADAKIDVISHDRASGAYEIFKAKVLGDDAVVTPEATIPPGDLAAAMTPNSISYTGMNAVGKLREVTVNGVAGSIKTVKSGEYPIIRASCLYQRSPGSALGNSFIDFIFTPAGQAALVAHHTVPTPRVNQ